MCDVLLTVAVFVYTLPYNSRGRFVNLTASATPVQRAAHMRLPSLSKARGRYVCDSDKIGTQKART